LVRFAGGAASFGVVALLHLVAEEAVMLVELGLVEQRYQAVLEVLNDGASVTDVARRYGVARQTVHVWLGAYATGGLGGLADRSSRPLSCPHQMPPVVEARIVALRREHPGWGSRTILYWLGREGISPLPGRTSVDRCLTRHGLISPQPRRRKRADYRRWERARAMELWQLDIVGGVRLADGSEAKIVSGIDDHSRFVVSAQVVVRATAVPVCDALQAALARHGVPEAILTDIQARCVLGGWVVRPSDAKIPGSGARPSPLLDRLEPCDFLPVGHGAGGTTAGGGGVLLGTR
jgi:transposase